MNQLKKLRELKQKQIKADKQFALHEMKTLQKDDLKLVKVYPKRPPEVVLKVMTIVIVLFQNYNRKQDLWKQILALLGETKTDQCVEKFHNFDAENLPREILLEVEAMIEESGYDFSYEQFKDHSKVASKFVQWINGVITIARCRYVLDDLSNNINKLELKCKKFGKNPANIADYGMRNTYAVVPQGGKKVLISPRRGPMLPYLSTDMSEVDDNTVRSSKKKGKGSASPAKQSALKNSNKKPPPMKYPYDDRLPSMISQSIDDFISGVADNKAKQLCDEEVNELSEEIKHQMTLSKEMYINKVDGAYYNNALG